MRWLGRIRPDSPRAEAWRKTIGDQIPLVFDSLHTATFPEMGEQPCYKVDIERLSFPQIERLVKYLSERFRLPRYEILKLAFDENCGIAVPADEVYVEITDED